AAPRRQRLAPHAMGLQPSASGCCSGGGPRGFVWDEPGQLSLPEAGGAAEVPRCSAESGADEAAWLPAGIAPRLSGAEAARAAREWASRAEGLRRRTLLFLRRTSGGSPCRLVDQQTGLAAPARYRVEDGGAVLVVEELGSAPSREKAFRCKLADVRNIWVCSDSELARRAHGALRRGAADAHLACVLLIDAPAGPLALVERSSEAREEFLDCMAVLVATQRLRAEPRLAACAAPGGLPPPEARLRPPNGSLRSAHLSGPICAWLARAGEGAVPPAAGAREAGAPPRAPRRRAPEGARGASPRPRAPRRRASHPAAGARE
ncbi:unnamed protein product, partial [Prorocentrum cordatum]